MNLNEYQFAARRTAKYPAENGIIYTGLALAGEAGEYANELKKAIRDDDGDITVERKVKLIGELGDVLWYVAMAAHELQMPLEEIAHINLVKLHHRHHVRNAS